MKIKEKAIAHIVEFLEINESSASAYCLVAGNLSETETQKAYERSEADNDELVRSALQQKTITQLLELASDCLEIANEKTCDLEE